MATAYDVMKLLHLLGVVLLLGNVTVTSIWKLYADATGDVKVVAFAQRLVTITDWFFTFWGILLLVAGGYGAAWIAGMDVIRDGWILWSELLFLLAGLIWLLMLVPIQIKQARMARMFAAATTIPSSYRRLSRLWILGGLAATVPLVCAMWIMVAKPV
jgi:uncharacterized membrane protein